ncbi:hypothetical protein LIER_42325 [Lithospermum erythrorhizon]|uniref:Replication protein A1 n=1 Tax=Lithospermum erythrorhizon TaxID=34254 RepID=A0AAV3RMX8_LITER
MEENNLLIPRINLETESWTAEVSVIEEMPTLTGSRSGTIYKRYVLIDDEECVAPVSSVLHLFGVFNITNAQLIANQIHWVLQRSTLIRPMPTSKPNLSTLIQKVVPFNKIVDTLDHDDLSIDIIGVIIRAEDRKRINTQFGEGTIQRFILVDMGRRPIFVSLWDEMTLTIGPLLEEAVNNFSIILATFIVLEVGDGVFSELY